MTKHKNSIVAIIPAKSDSKRLRDKNMVPIDGKPLLYYTIKAARECPLISAVYVSTESDKIAKFSQNEGAAIIKRPKELCADVPIVEVYRHALNNIKNEDILYVVGLQPDHPDRVINLQDAIKYAIEKGLDDLISVDSNGNKNGSIRIIKAEALRKSEVSVNLGSIMDNATNIHTPAE